MKREVGKEMKRLILWGTVVTLSLFAVVIGYFMVDVAVTTSRNIEKNKQLAIDQSVLTLQEMARNISNMNTNATVISNLNQEVLGKIAKGQTELLLPLMTDLAIAYYPVDYVSETQNGEVLYYRTPDGAAIDTSTLPAVPASGTYTTLDRLGDQEGFFVSVYYPINIPIPGYENVVSNFVVDRTVEVKQIETYFNQQRNSQLLRLGIVALISFLLFGLLTTLGQRYMVGRFVMRPIDQLNAEAEGIITGTFDGEVKVDQESSFAPIQGLLRSGQKVLRRLDAELGV
jgi:hypothetical protein